MNASTLFRRVIVFCVMIGAVIFTSAFQKIERFPMTVTNQQFNGARAHQLMTRLAKDFPNRTPWSESRKKAALWLKKELQTLGFEPQGMNFSEVIDGKQYADFENIYAEKRGTTKPEEIIAIVAHYDITDTTVEGAMDDASGVAVVLELARVFARQNSARTLLFLLTDSEEYGAFWGARSFVNNYPKAGGIIATLNFDFVAPEKQVAILTLCDGLKSGYTPLWLREMAVDAVRIAGQSATTATEAVDMVGVLEHIQRAMQIPAADHGAFLAANIPAFNWIGQAKDFAYQMAHYHHTKHDVSGVMQVESFDVYGRAAEILLHSLNAIPKIPENFRKSDYWKITTNRYLEGWAVTLLHVLAFIPFLFLTITKVREIFIKRRSNRELIKTVFLNELKSISLVFGALLIGYGVMLVLPALRLIPEYEIFPATQKSAILYSPNFLAMLIVLACTGATYYLFFRTFRTKTDSQEELPIRLALHALVLCLVIVLAMAKNSYLATLLLLPPAYLWGALRLRRRVEDRIFNSILIGGGMLTFFIITIIMSTAFHIGVMYWYLFLSMVYGLFSAYAVILALLAIAIVFRLIRKFVL